MNTKAKLLIAASATGLFAVLAAPAYAQVGASTPPSGEASPADQSVGSAALAGRVIDAATGEYLRDAVVEVEAAGQPTRTGTTGEGGVYRLQNLPAGPARVTIRFIGYLPQTQDVVIRPGGTVDLDVSLQQSGRGDQAASASDIVVNGIRAAGARELMEQRNELQIADVLSTAAYGDIAGGNPAEFLKYMPGADVDGTNGTAVYAYLRGLPAEFTRTQLNGMDIVSANSAAPTGYANSAAAARIFSYESIAMSAIDSVTTYKTVGADQNADAPAGIINLRTKHAYDRNKSLLVVSVEAFTHENMLDRYKHTGPASHGWGNKRFLPNASLFYSNSFLNNRLGVMFSLSFSDQYIEREQITMNRQYTQSVNAPYPMEFYGMNAKMGARQTTRRNASLVLDYKVDNHLSLSLVGLASRGDVNLHEQSTTVTADTKKGDVGLLDLDGQPATAADALSGFRTRQSATAQTISSAPDHYYKVNNGNVIAPSFNWDAGNWHLDGYFAYSDSHSYYNSPHSGQVFKGSTITSTGNFQAVKRSSDLAYTDWAITQLDGPDWADPASYKISGKPSITLRNASFGKLTQKSGALNARYEAQFGTVPVDFQTGFKFTDTRYEFGKKAADNVYTYAGSLTNEAFLAQVINPYISGVTNKSDFTITSLSGSAYIPSMDLAKLWDMYQQNPGDWANATTAADHATAYYTGTTKFDESIRAIYGMATADVTPRLQLRAGLRAEWTNNTAFVYRSLPVAEVEAYTPDGATAPCAVKASTGIATTIPCVDYQFSEGVSRVKGHYFTLFPSGSAKYTFGESTDLQAGYSRTILRPGVNAAGSSPSEDLTGSSLGGPILTVPNPGLTPALSDNYSIRLSRYFQGVGMLNVGFYYNRIKGLAVQKEYSADEAAKIPALAPYAADPAYAGYSFATYFQDSLTTIKGIEASFQHSLTWLPAPFDGLSVRANFMHNEPNHPITRVGTNIGSAGVMYEKGPVQLHMNLLWNDDKYRSDTPTWFRARTNMTISGKVKLTKHWQTYFSVHNVLGASYNVIIPGNAYPSTAAANLPNYSAIYVQNGRTFTFGVRARF